MGAPGAERTSGRRRPGPRQVAIALLVAGAILAAVEVVFRLSGDDWQPVVQPASRGYDPAERYVVEAPDGVADGGFTTHIFDGGEHEVHIPPKGERRRVLLIGGSNTRLLPGDFLQRLLDERDAPQAWEVINLGRHGYGSTRERVLLEQAMVLQPDVVFVYSGHNEFIDEHFRNDVEAAQGAWGQQAAEALRRLKTVDTLVSEMRRVAREAAPDGGETAYKNYFARWTEAQRDGIYDRFRENLAAMCRIARERGARIVLGTNVRNMFHAPQLSRSGLHPEDPQVPVFRELLAQAVARLPSRYVDGVFPQITIAPFDWGLQTGQWWEEFYQPEAAGLEHAPPFPQPDPATIEAAARLVARWPSPPIAPGALWTPPAVWSDRARRVVDTLALVHAAAPEPADRDALQTAAAELERAVAMGPDHAGARFLLALCRQALGGDRAQVARLLDEAADRDWAPIVGNNRINAIVREVAGAIEGAELLDADARFRSRAPDGIVDYELLMDANHLNPGARLLLLQDLADLVLGPR